MKSRSSSIAWILLRPTEKLRLIVIALLYFVSTLLDMAFIALTIPFVSALNQGTSHGIVLLQFYKFMGRERFYEKNPLAAILVLLFLALFSRLIVRYIAVQQESVFKTRITSRLSTDLYEFYLDKSIEFHSQENSASIITDVLNMRQINDHVYEPWLKILTEASAILLIVVLLIFLSPMATVLGIVLLSLIVLVHQKFVGKISYRLGETTLEGEKASLGLVKETLSGVAEIQLYKKKRFFVDKFSLQNIRGIRARNSSHRLQALTPLFLEFSGFSVVFLMILLFFLPSNDKESLLPLLSGFVVALFRLLPSFAALHTATQRLRFGKAQVARQISSLIDLQPIPHGHFVTEQPTNSKFQYLKFSNVSFQFATSERESISEISLRIDSGLFVGIIGESGSGKSTFANLLLGLLEPSSGSVQFVSSLQGIIPHQEIRFGYVPQFVHMFDLSIAENVAFGVPKEAIDNHRVMRSLSNARLGHLPSQYSTGLDAIIGENGAMLSGGERQRLGIARALYLDPDILVLDEATSALDAQNEGELLNLLLEFRRTMTTIFITHRLSAVVNCDELFLMHNGKLVEHGTVETVLKRQSLISPVSKTSNNSPHN